MGAFVVSKRFNGQFKFVFTSRKGKVIFTSSGYDMKEQCEADITISKFSVSEEWFTRLRASNGKYFFKLHLEERLIAVSRKYTTELRMKKGIDEILSYASKAEVLDFSEDSFVFPD